MITSLSYIIIVSIISIVAGIIMLYFGHYEWHERAVVVAAMSIILIIGIS